MGYEEIDQHVEDCNMRPSHCPNFPKCMFSGLKVAVMQHYKDCKSKDDLCEFCETKVKHNDHDPANREPLSILNPNIKNNRNNAQSKSPTHDCLYTLNDLIRTSIRHKELSNQRLERRMQERNNMK